MLSSLVTEPSYQDTDTQRHTDTINCSCYKPTTVNSVLPLY